MIGFIITLVIVGLIAGALARLIIPGKQDLSIPATILLGIVGSFVGGFLAALIFGGDIEFTASGIIGSIIGAVIVLFLWTRFGSGKTRNHH
jgi:uncharacterized membrane protein YeaQ/YmgE (transglycosylase-associated protein family)